MSVGKYLVNIITFIAPPHRQGVIVEASTVEEAKQKAIDKVSSLKKYRNRAPTSWLIKDVTLLGSAKK